MLHSSWPRSLFYLHTRPCIMSLLYCTCQKYIGGYVLIWWASSNAGISKSLIRIVLGSPLSYPSILWLLPYKHELPLVNMPSQYEFGKRWGAKPTSQRQNDCNRIDAITCFFACLSGHTTWQRTMLCYNTNRRERKCKMRRIIQKPWQTMSPRKWTSQPSRSTNASPSASTTSPSSHVRIVLSMSCGDCERNRSASASSSSPKSELPLPDRWRLSSHSFFSSSTSCIVLRRTRWRRKSSWRKFESSCANLRCLRPLTCWINQETISPRLNEH